MQASNQNQTANGFVVPDGNDILKADIPTIVKLIERTACWVDRETFRQLPVWAPHAARGRPLYYSSWDRRKTNTRKATGNTAEKTEGNVEALKALLAALDVASPKPKNWTVCHVWGYDDPSFTKGNNVVQDARYYSCVGNMVWLPTPLKGFTDSVKEIKDVLRVCAFQLYGFVCDLPGFEDDAAKIKSGSIPDCYPKSWPQPKKSSAVPQATSIFTPRIADKIARRKQKIKADLANPDLKHYPHMDVRDVLEHWKIKLD